MGLLDKWTKKKQQEQLSAVEQAGAVDSTTKEAEKKTKKSKPDVKETKSSPAVGGGAAYRIIRHPLVSEKTAREETMNQYAFAVDKRATKIEIKNAIKELYGVMPRKVRVAHMQGKQVRFGYTQGKRSDWKKAIVSLPAGKSIHIHEGV